MMDLMILALVGVSSAISLIVAFILCAKRQSFTIEHDYDPNYISPSVRAKNAYRVRQVHQLNTNVLIENGHSKSRGEFADENDNGAKKGTPERVAKNDVKVDFEKETPEAPSQQTNKASSGGTPSHPDKDRLKNARRSEVQRESSKRKAPTAPGVPTASGLTSDRSTPKSTSSPAKQSTTSSTVSVAKPTHSDTTPSKAPTPQGQKGPTSNPQRQSKKTAAPAPKQTPTKAADALIKREAPMTTSPKSAPVKKAAPTSGTGSLPRATKTTPSPEKVRYVKKSSTLPGRSSSKRQAPVAPGQGQAVTLTVPKTESTEPSIKNTTKADDLNSKPTVAPGQNPGEPHASGNNTSVLAEKRSSRNVLDRLPSLPKENSFDSGLDVKESGIASVSVGSDSIDGPHDDRNEDTLEEDPYSVIKNRKMGEESVENDNAVNNEESKSSAPIQNDALVDSFAIQEGDQHDKETPVAKDDGIVLELVPDQTDGSPTETAVKVKNEPPYAKVIKKNKRNRANVRVHFSAENPEEIKPKKPPTPGALISMSRESKDEKPLDDSMIIPEAASYD